MIPWDGVCLVSVVERMLGGSYLVERSSKTVAAAVWSLFTRYDASHS